MRKYSRCLMAGLLFITVLLTCLYGCGRLNQTESQDSDHLPVIKVGGAIYEPYFYKDIDGDYSGIDVELAKTAFARMGYQPEFVAVDLSDVDTALETGKIDCFWSCFTMETREDKYLWSEPYLYTRRVVVVKADSKIKDLSDLEDKTIAVQSNSMMEKIFLNNMSPDIPENYEMNTYRSIAEIFTALRKDYVDAIGGHEATLRLYTEEYPDEYRYLNLSLYKSKLGVAFDKAADQRIIDELNQTLAAMSADGTIQKVLTDYHLDVATNLYGGNE